MQSPVSVVIPVYNRYPMLLEALRSVLAQTVPPREIVVVDDGSSDISGARAAAIRGLDPRIAYHRISHCGMPGTVRNRGVELSSGEWIALLDSDDIWYPSKLQRQLECAAVEPQAPLVHTRERWLRGNREVSQAGQTHRRAGRVFADALVKCIIGPSTVIIRRRLYTDLGGFRGDMEIAEDYEFWLRVTAHYPVAYIDRPLVDKRAGHGEQLSEKYGQVEQFRIEGLLPLVEEGYFVGTAQPAAPHVAPEADGLPLSGAEMHRLACAELARKCGIYAAGAARRGRHAEAERYRAVARRYSSR